jgi:hypothetical protein
MFVTTIQGKLVANTITFRTPPRVPLGLRVNECSGTDLRDIGTRPGLFLTTSICESGGPCARNEAENQE